MSFQPFYQDKHVAIVHGDALHLPIADDSVDLVVTSPPYFGLRSYQDGGEHYDGQIGAEVTPDGFVTALIAATREMVRVVKPTGSIWVNLGDKYSGYSGAKRGHGRDMTGERGDTLVPVAGPVSAPSVYGIPNKSLMGIPWRYALRCIDELGLILREEIVWSKPNGLPESVKDRARRSHEQWFHFTLQSRYYADMDPLRQPLLDQSDHAATRRSRTDARLDAAGAGRTSAANPRGALPGSVWTIATEPLRLPEHLGVKHFAAFPTEWPRRIIKGWCPPGGIVLDPFGGTGTVGLVAKTLGMHAILNDLSLDYCRVMEWRVNDPKQLAKNRLKGTTG